MTIIPYSEWGRGIVPNHIPGRISLPAPRVWLHHGGDGKSTIQTARAYARYHIVTLGWHHVGYSFLIAEGKVLEGRGAGRRGAHTKYDNRQSHGICLVGDYRRVRPSDADIDALVWLLRHGHEQGWWPEPELTGGHRDAPGASSSCPGEKAHVLIPDINRRGRQEDDMTPEQERRILSAIGEVNDRVNEVQDNLVNTHLRPIRRAWRAVLKFLRLDVSDGP